MRKKDKCRENAIIQGTTPGKHPRGRPKTSWLGNIRLWTGLTEEEMLRTVEDRKRRKIAVYDTVNLRIEDD